jgi:rubrerythrin
MRPPPLLASLDALEIHHLKNVLEAAGIRCWIRNEMLARLAGEIPFTECSLELHLADEADRPRAEALREACARPPEPGPAWICSGCGETIEGQFGACWRCGRALPP